MNIKKICIMILLVIVISGCKNSELSNDPNVDKQISKMEKINLNNFNESLEESPFYIESVFEMISPAITYTNNDETTSTEVKESTTDEEETKTTSEENLAKINLARIINLQLKYTEDSGEKPEKIILNNVKVIKKPKKGKSKLHAIKKGNNYTYLRDMRENEITSAVEFEKDLVGNKLEDGEQNIRFSFTIDEIVKSTTDELLEKDYLEILKENNITGKDLEYTVEFVITIHTKNNIYASKLEFESMDLDIYTKRTDLISYSSSPIYFQKLETE